MPLASYRLGMPDDNFYWAIVGAREASQRGTDVLLGASGRHPERILAG
ncbi:hypothetical protein CS8_078280 [Cupriavidus sp. 8B]